MAKAHALLERAQRDFAAADRALKAGRAAEWARLTHQARSELAKALNLLK
jgi:HEPN domain-containing protein